MTNRVHIGNLDATTTSATIQAAFGCDGRTVTSVQLVMSREPGCSGRSETDPPAALKLDRLRARVHTGSAPVAEPLEVDFLASAGDLRRWR